VSPLDPFAASAEAKRTAALLHDARAALRKLDVLVAQAVALDDPAAVPAGEARATVERLVRDLERREQGQQRRAREAARRSR
jgi:hypothetical protein